MGVGNIIGDMPRLFILGHAPGLPSVFLREVGDGGKSLEWIAFCAVFFGLSELSTWRVQCLYKR